MIRWINDVLGTAPFDKTKGQQDYEVVDVRAMRDDFGNSSSIILDKVEEAIGKIQDGKKVVICCDQGISRSNSIAIGVYSKLYQIEFYEAAKYVMKKINEKQIKSEVLSCVYNTLHDSKINSDVKQDNIFVTGNRGFIGSRIVPVLRKNFTVYAPTRNELDLYNAAELDLYIKSNRITKIIHLAKPRISNSIDAMGESISILKNILTVCQNNHLHLVYLSGWVVYSGYKTASLRVFENTVQQASDIYAQTKYLMECLLKMHIEDFPITTIRPCGIYGIESEYPKFIYNFIAKAVKDEDIVVHKFQNGLPCLDLLYIDDFIEIFEKIVVSKVIGNFNVGTGIITSTTDIAKEIIHKLSSKSNIKTVDMLTECSNIIMDNSKVKNYFNWEPKISLAEGLDCVINNVKEK